MNNKHSETEKTTDAVKSSKPVEAGPAHVVLPKRSALNNATAPASENENDSHSDKHASAARPKRIVISPVSSEEQEKSEPAPNTPTPAAAAADVEPPSSLAEVKLPEDAGPDKTNVAAKEKAENPDKPSPETLKAVEAAAKREHELQAYIDSHQFFVPINAEERKRSIKVSFGLTFLLFVLGVLLIDLMLDSGIIELIQKIPHTHFFSS